MTPATTDIRRLTTADVSAMYEHGVLAADERVELEEGILVRMVPIGPEHSSSLRRLTQRFAVASDGAPWEVAVQDQLNFPGGYRHPDLIVHERLRFGEQPETALLIVEVAESSQRRDREKALRYAQLAVDEYWIVDLPAGVVLVHRRPGSDGYAERTEVRAGAVLSAASVPGGPAIAVAELFGD